MDGLEPFLTELGRVTSKGGVVVFTLHNLDAFSKPKFNYSVYCPVAHSVSNVYKSLERSGWSIEEVDSTFHFRKKNLWRLLRVIPSLF